MPTILLAPVAERSNTGEVLESLLGTCLQTALEKHGSGLEGAALTQEFNSVLSLVSAGRAAESGGLGFRV